jgi:hypothetical protein
VTGITGELRDNRLPSERITTAPKAPASLPFERTPFVYDQFRSDTKGLTIDQKLALRKRFEAKLQDPRVQGQQEQVKYYSSLIAILDEK